MIINLMIIQANTIITTIITAVMILRLREEAALVPPAQAEASRARAELQGCERAAAVDADGADGADGAADVPGLRQEVQDSEEALRGAVETMTARTASAAAHAAAASGLEGRVQVEGELLGELQANTNTAANNTNSNDRPNTNSKQ